MAIRTRLDKWYEVSDYVLGRGSFSTVYLAYHSSFKNKVALKIIDRNNIKEEYVLKNLRREANLLMKLSHPNIVNFYEEFSYRDAYCLSMEYVNGVNLHRYLKKQKSFKMSEDDARPFFYQMLSAVDHMHKLNILHRDLKQENILVEFGRVIKIIDFGLSNVYHPNIQLRTHCGSLVYAAPELFETRSVYGTAVDLWSLGVILYSMVIGEMPFGIPKIEEDSVCDNKKIFFLKRISKGLTSENKNRMTDLSSDCFKILENLLQPNQFKRLKIKKALMHPWFVNYDEFKSRLPQERLDLKHKFKFEIIDFMAERMGVSTEQIELQVSNFKFSKISAIYFIAQDTLIKEVLYPPRNVEHTFLYKLECRRKSALGEDSFDEDENITGTSNCKGHGMVFRRPDGSGFLNQKVPRESKLMPQNFVNTASVRKSAGDGSNFAQNISSRQAMIDYNQARVNCSVSASKQVTDKSETDLYIRTQGEKGDCRTISHNSTTKQPFRSYKRSRPPRFQVNSDEYNATNTEENETKDEKPTLTKRIPRVTYENPIDVSELAQKFNISCAIDSHFNGEIQTGQQRSTSKPTQEIASRFYKTESSRQYPTKILSTRGTSELPQSRPATRGREDKHDAVITSSSRTHREPILKESYLFQDSRQKARAIPKDYIPIITYRRSKVPACEFIYDQSWKPAFETSMRNNIKEYRNNSHQFHMNTRVFKKRT